MIHSSYTLAFLADHLDADLIGDANCRVTGIASLEKAKPGDISFLSDVRYRRFLSGTQASAILLSEDMTVHCLGHQLRVKNPALAFVKLARLFMPTVNRTVGIHPTASVDPSAHMGKEVVIGPNVVIGVRAHIGEGTVIEAGSVIGEGAIVGNHCHLHPHVTIYPRIQLGNEVCIQSGAVIGSAGFGNVLDEEGRWVAVPQLGSVVIGHQVDIGANTTIDCGALEDTVIGNGVKLDNQIQVAHNVIIGEHTAIAGCVGIAGSTVIGKHCLIGGGTCINGHLEITDRVIISGMSMVTKSILKPGIYSSGTGLQENKAWQRNVVRFRQLDDMAKRLKQLEGKLNE